MLIKEQLIKYKKHSDIARVIASYFLDNIDSLTNESLRSIANKIYVAPSSIVRFCQSLGYEGYNEFKKAYLDEENYLTNHFQEINPNYPFNANDKNTVVANKISQLYHETIEDCLSLISHDSLQQAINILINAKYIYICASGAQTELANVFKSKMIKIGKTVIINNHTDDLYFGASYCDQDCAFILISYSGETEKVVSIVKKLNERHIPTIAITSYGSNTLSKYSSCTLYVSTREKLIHNLGTFGLHISTMYLLDVLYGNVFNANYSDNLKNKIKFSKEIEKKDKRIGRFSTNIILNDENDVL